MKKSPLQISNNPFEKYYTLVLLQLTRRPRSEKELRDYLVKKKADPEIIDQVVAKVKKEKFQDDQLFTKWWVASRNRYKAKSNRIIYLELRQKGIPTEVIEKAIQEKNDDYQTDYQKAFFIAEKYMKKIKDLPYTQKNRRLGNFLGRRGFDFETIRRVIDDVL